MMWVRWTLPRLRIDQVMMTCIKYLVPITCALLLGVSAWQLAASQVAALAWTNYVIAGLCVAGAALLFLKLFTSQTLPPSMQASGWTPSPLLTPPPAQQG
jgi:NADH-quinone oxidoreductase subunit H